MQDESPSKYILFLRNQSPVNKDDPMVSDMGIADNYRLIAERVSNTAVECGRNPESVKIVAVSKTHPADAITEAQTGGARIFGENKIQEAKQKFPLLSGKFEYHLVGHLQSNKAKDAVRIFDLIHSIDSFSTAEKVDREASAIGKVQRILVQVNTSGEESKSGIHPDETKKLCTEIAALKHLSLEGLMTIGPLSDNEEMIRASFSLLADLRKSIEHDCGISLPELSMGMSGDYQIAISKGATLVRIGSAIFGNRTYPQ